MYVLELAGEDDAFAAAEAASAATDVTLVAPGVATASAVDRERFRGLAFARRASEVLVATDADLAAAVVALETAATGRAGRVAVRARNVRNTASVDTQSVERELGQVLVDRGFRVDLDAPDHVLVALFADDSAFLGWETVESRRDYGSRAPTDRPFFQPGSMDPLLARAVVNLATIEAGDHVLDPMCGTGGILIEAALVGGRPVGFDAQSKMVRGARENLREYVDSPSVGLADATELPVRDDGVDAIVFDVPYGRQSRIATHSLGELIEGALHEARRAGARAVVVADRRYGGVAQQTGWSLEAVYDRRVHRSLTRYVHVLS